ncbi:MAG: hypothetical protein WC642_15885 [Nocardioides sp.]
MEISERPGPKPRTWWARLSWLVLGALGGVAVLLVLEVALPGPLPAWVGYAIAAPCLGFVYLQNRHARRGDDVYVAV